jgi:hypothetical protein
MSNDIIRRYMEAVREMSNARRFNGKAVIQKYRLSHSTSSALKKFGYTERLDRSTVWVGPRPRTEDELRAMAVAIRGVCNELVRVSAQQKKGTVKYTRTVPFKAKQTSPQDEMFLANLKDISFESHPKPQPERVGLVRRFIRWIW